MHILHLNQRNQRNQILFQYLRDKKKKKIKGAQKRGGGGGGGGGVKIHPFHLPWIRAWFVTNKTVSGWSVSKEICHDEWMIPCNLLWRQAQSWRTPLFFDAINCISRYLQTNNWSGQPLAKMQQSTCCVPSLSTLLTGQWKCYYILRQILLHFVLPLHFASKVLTFCITITFCGVTASWKEMCYGMSKRCRQHRELFCYWSSWSSFPVWGQNFLSFNAKDAVDPLWSEEI